MALRPRSRHAASAPDDTVHLERMLEAIPEAAEGVEAASDSRGRVQLRRELPPPEGIAGVIARALRFRRTIRVNLDPQGTRFWSLVDGRRTLHGISHSLLDDAEVTDEARREAVVLFTRVLMSRHMLILRIEPPEPSDAQ